MLSLQDFERGVIELALSLSGSAAQWCHQSEARWGEGGVAQLTRVGHELKGAAEFSVAGRRASAHMKNVGGDGGETLDVGIPGWGFYDSVAPFILVLWKKI